MIGRDGNESWEVDGDEETLGEIEDEHEDVGKAKWINEEDEWECDIGKGVIDSTESNWEIWVRDNMFKDPNVTRILGITIGYELDIWIEPSKL